MKTKITRIFLITLLLLFVISNARGVYAEEDNPETNSNGNDSNGWSWNPLNWFGGIVGKIAEAFAAALSWLADRLHDLAMGALRPIFEVIVKLVLANPVPEYADWGSEEEVSWYELRTPEILELYSVSKTIAYALLPVVIVIGALAVGLEGFGFVREGEGILILKRSIWIAVLIPLSMPLYEYSVHMLSAITHAICPPDKLAYYFGVSVTGVGLLAFIIDPLIFLFLLIIAIAGALRILAIATLAAILPLLIVLSLVPLVGRIARSLIEVLVSLAFTQLVTGAMISMAVSIAGSIYGSGWVEGMVKLIIAFASLAVPLIAPMLIGRSGFATFAASTLLGYTAWPMFLHMRGYVLKRLEGKTTIAWGPRITYKGAKVAARLTKKGVSTAYWRYRGWRLSRIKEESADIR